MKNLLIFLFMLSMLTGSGCAIHSGDSSKTTYHLDSINPRTN